MNDTTKSCTTLVCNDNQVKAKLIGDPENCRCCDIDFVDETKQKIKLYYNFDIVTVKNNKLRNMSVNTDLTSNIIKNIANFRYYKLESKTLRGPNPLCPQIGDLLISYNGIQVQSKVINKFDCNSNKILDFNYRKVQKIRIEGNDYLLLSQVIIYDINNNKAKADVINASEPLQLRGNSTLDIGNNIQVSNANLHLLKLIVVDGTNEPRQYPLIYHSGTQVNSFWEMIFNDPVNVKNIVIHTRSDWGIDRLSKFNMVIFLDNNTTVTQPLDGVLTQTIINSNNSPNINAYILDCETPKIINQYTIKTSLSNPENDIISWSFFGSNDNLSWILLDTKKNIDIPLQRTLVLPYYNISYSLIYDALLSNINIITTNGLLGPNSVQFINKNQTGNICSDFVTIDLILLDNNTFTISMWLTKEQIETNNLNFNKYILQFQNITKTVTINIYVYQNIVYINLNLSGGSVTFPINDTISYINSWFHLLWTFDGKDWYVYLNGIQNKYPKVGSFLNNEIFSYNIIGCSLDKNPNTCFTGKIDDFKFYNSYFTSDMVDVLYAAGSKYINPLPTNSIELEVPNFMIQVNNSILCNANTNAQYGFTSKNTISGPIMLTINPPPINCSIGFSENKFEEFGVIYGYKTIDEGGHAVIPIAPGYINQPKIRPITGNSVENNQTMNLKLLFDGENIKYMINDTVICIRPRINTLPLYVVGNLFKIGQFIYKMELTNKIPIQLNKIDDLMYLSLNNDKLLAYNLQFKDTDYYEADPLTNSNLNNNKLITKIRIDGTGNWLQIAQLTVYDISNNKIIFNNTTDTVNASDPWDPETNKFKPLDGSDMPRPYPQIYQSRWRDLPFWEIIYKTPKKIKSITVHTRSDCCIERIVNFSLKLFLQDGSFISCRLTNKLTTTLYFINDKLFEDGVIKYIKNNTKTNLPVKIWGSIRPVKEDTIYALKLSNIKSPEDQYIELPSLNITNDGLSFAFWFKGTNSLQWARIFDLGIDNNIVMAINSSQSYLHLGTLGSNTLLYFKNYNFEWIHVGWVLNKNLKTWYVYLNGSAIFTIPNANYPSIVERRQLYIGKSNLSEDPNLNGFITDFRIYNRELSSKEVSVLYTSHQLKKTLDIYKNLDKNEIIKYNYSLIKNPKLIIDNITSKSLVTLNTTKNTVTNMNQLGITSTGPIQFKNFKGLDYINLTGVNFKDYVIIPNINLSPNGLTFLFWIKPIQFLTGTNIFDFGKGYNNYNITCYISSKTELTFAILGEPNNYINTIEFGDLSEWTHVTWSINTNSIWTIYKNGILIKTINGGYPTITLRNFNFIGKSNSPNDIYLNYCGYMDDFRMYYRILTVNEILTINKITQTQTQTQEFIDLNNDNALVLYYDFKTFNGNKIINKGKNEGIVTFTFDNSALPTKTKYNIINQNISLNSSDNNYTTMIINKDQKVIGFNSLYFNKLKRDFISFNPFQTDSTGITISFWFKSINTPTWARMFDFGNGPSSDNIFVFVNNNFLSCSVYNSRGESNFYNFYKNPNPVTNRSIDVNINDNVWRHFTWVIEPYSDGVYANWYIYINGELLKPSPNTNITRANTLYPRPILRKNIYLGKSNWEDPYYNGCIEDFRFYNKILTNNDIISLYTLKSSQSLDTDTKLVFSTNLINTFKPATNNPSYCFNSLFKQYISIDTIKTDTNGLSFSFWIMQNNTIELSKIFDFGSNIICEYNFGSLYFYINQKKETNRLISDIKLPNNVWVHVTWTINQNKISKFYINGKLKTVISSVYPLNIIRNNNFIGRGSSINDIYFDGFISDFYIIDKELTDVEINNIYNLNKHTDSVLFYINGDPKYLIIQQIPLNKPTLTYNPPQYNPIPSIKDNNSLNFQYNDFLQINSFICDQNNIYNGYTFSFWFKSKNSKSWARFFDFGNGESNNNIVVGINNNYIFCSVYDGRTDSRFYNFYKINNIDININDDIWRHFVWVIVPNSQSDKSKASWYIYINGELMKPDPTINATRINTLYPTNILRTNNFLGKSNWNDPYLFGSIDDFRMYNRILTNNEINALYTININQPSLNDKLIINSSTFSNKKINSKLFKFSHSIFSFINVSKFSLEKQSLSISFWFKTLSSTTPLVEFSNSEQSIKVCVIDGFIYVQHDNINIKASDTLVNNNTWVHFIWIIDSVSKWDIYLNNIKTHFEYFIPLSSNYTTNQIGKITNLQNYTFTGFMSEFRVFNKKLIDNEITILFNNNNLSTINNDSLQIIYLTFDENKIKSTFIPGTVLDATLTKSIDATLTKSTDTTLTKSIDATLTKSTDVTLTKSTDATLTKSIDVTLTKSIDVTLTKTSLLLNDKIDNSYLAIDKFSINNSGFTIAFWYNFELLNNDNAKLIDFNNFPNYFKIYITQNFIFNIDIAVNNVIKNNTINLSNYVNTWFHFAIILTQTVFICYINGQTFTILTNIIYPDIKNNTINYIGKGTPLPKYVTSIPNINVGTNYIVPLNNSWEYYNVQWTGYFYTKTLTTGNKNWTFFTYSDDASYLWVGNNAFSGYTIDNATVKNGGIHEIIKSKGTISLSPNTYYYIRIIFGERGGSDNMVFSFISPDEPRTEIFNGFDYLFNDGKNNNNITLNVVDKKSGLLFNIYKGTYWEESGGIDYFKNTIQMTITDDPINCNISDFRICNSILTDDEINVLYLDTMNKMLINNRSNENPLLINFKFEDDNYYANTINNNILLKPTNNTNDIMYDSLIKNYFNTLNNILNIDPFEITNNHITFSFWYKTTLYNGGINEILFFASNNLLYGLKIENNTLILIHRNNNYNTKINYITNNQWHLITVIYKTTNQIILYIDNKLEWTNNDMQFINIGFINSAYIGNGTNESGISDFRLYNKELSLDEILILFKQKYIIPPFILTHYYRFENEFKNEVTGINDAFANDINILSTKAKKEGLYGAIFNKNNFISLPNLIIKKTGISVSLWYKQTSYINNSNIFEFFNNLGVQYNLATINNNFIVNMVLKGKITQTYSLDSFFGITNNIWYLLTVILESNGICSLYVNDKLQSKANLKFYPDEQIFYGMIAKNMDCKIDEFKIYENVISYDEIIKNYNIKAQKTIIQYINDLNIDNSLVLFYMFKNKLINTQKYKFKNNTINDTKIYNLLSNKFDVTINLNFISNINPLYDSGYLTLFGNDMSKYPLLSNFTSDINGFSVSIWFRSKMTPTNSYIRLIQLRNPGINDTILVSIRNNTMCVGLYNTTINWVINENFSNIQVNDNEWHHFVWNILPDGIWAVYLDNIQILNQIDRPYPKAILRNNNFIGRSDNLSDMFIGDIDEIRIYNRILDEEEINAIYNLDTISGPLINLPNINNNIYSSQPAYNLITPKNLQNVIAWYDPNDIIVDKENEVTTWPNQISSSTNSLNIKLGSIVPVIYSSNLQMLNFKTNTSYLRSTTQDKIAGFACVINIKNISNNDFDIIFSIDNNLSFRRGRKYQNTGIDNNDIINSYGGVISINGEDVFNYPSFSSSYDNTDNYIILYVKFGQYINNYSYDTDITYQISSNLNNRGFIGNIGDFITFNKNHTYYDQKLIEGYLSWKYGLQKQLPYNHPFISSPPININIPSLSYNLIDPTKIQNVVAWYDPNNVTIENNIVKTWINQITTNSTLNLIATGKITIINYNSNLKLLSINNNTSYLTTNNKTALMNGFICVVYLTNTNTNENMFGSSLIDTTNVNHLFKRGRINGIDNDDIHKGTGGILAINGTTYYDNQNINIAYNNTNNYVIIYVKFGIGTHGYDLTKQVNLIISNATNGMVGYIGDFICFNPKHNKRDQQKAEGYLAWKYGLQRLLPNNHPYKSIGPILPKDTPPIPLPINDGSSYYLPNVSGTKLKENFPKLPSGYYWIQTSTMTEPDRIFIDMVTDNGGWMLMYEVTIPTRNNNVINYNVNKIWTLGSTTPQRIAYYIQNGRNPSKFAWTSFNAWKDIINYDVPTGDSITNVFTIQRDVNNLNVISNVDSIFKDKDGVIDLGGSLKQMSKLEGRLEIWPSDYNIARNNNLTGGSNTTYDTNDSGFNTNIGYGSFQVHDMTNNQTIFAWNRHGDSRPDIGFGNNPNGHLDWSFTQTDPIDFKLQIFIKIDIPTQPIPTETNDGSTILKPNISSWKIKQLPNFISGYYYIQGPLAETPTYVYVDSTTNKDLINPLTISGVLAWYDPNNIELTGNFIYRWMNKVNKQSNIPIKSSNNTLITKVRIECNADDYLQLSQIIIHDQNNNIISAISVNASEPGFGTDKNTAIDNNIKARPHQTENKYTIYHSNSSSCPFYEIIINPSDIKSITIYNRTDCCNDKLTKFNLSLLNNSNVKITSIPLNKEFVQRYIYINSKLYSYDENLHLLPSGNIIVTSYLPKYNLVNFNFSLTPNNNKIADSFLTSGISKDKINAFVCLVKLINNNNSFDMIFAPQIQDSDTSFRSGRFSSGIDGNDIHNGSEGLVFINGNKVFDFDNKINVTYDNTNNFVILYVKFGNNVKGYDKNTTQIEAQISSFFLNRGVIGSVGDFFCLSSNHTQVERQVLEGYIAWKWELQTLLPNSHIYKSKLPIRNDLIALPTNDGTKYNLPNVSSDTLKQNFTNLPSGNYWIKIREMYEPESIYIDMKTDGGGWALVYETVTPKRINNVIPYTVNKSNSIGLSKPSRIAYRIENDGKYAWVSFDAWSLISSYDIPTGDSSNNVFSIQRDVTNMNIISNAPNLVNASGIKGRLQIWPSNYDPGKNILLAGGAENVYDCNNSGFDNSINQGAFQVFNINDINNPSTVFGWNRQRNDGNFEFGFGNNRNGNPDWTLTNSVPNNFKLQIFIKFDPINYTLPQSDLLFSGSKNVITDTNNNVISWTSVNNTNYKAIPMNTQSPKLIGNYIDFIANNNKSILTTNLNSTTTQNLTLFFALNVLATPNKLSQIISSGGIWGRGAVHILLNGNKLQVAINIGDENEWITPFIIIPNTDYVISIIIDNLNGCKSTCKINGSVISSKIFTKVLIPIKVNQLEFGNWSGDLNRALNGKLGEIIVFNRLLTDNETKQVETYMCNKYLPSTIGQNRIIN